MQYVWHEPAIHIVGFGTSIASGCDGALNVSYIEQTPVGDDNRFKDFSMANHS